MFHIPPVIEPVHFMQTRGFKPNAFWPHQNIPQIFSGRKLCLIGTPPPKSSSRSTFTLLHPLTNQDSRLVLCTTILRDHEEYLCLLCWSRRWIRFANFCHLTSPVCSSPQEPTLQVHISFRSSLQMVHNLRRAAST